MNCNKKKCKCPRKIKKTCRHTVKDYKDVTEIIEALTSLSEAGQKKKSRRQIMCKPDYRIHSRKLKCRGANVPMAPPMETRLRYIRHCPVESYNPTKHTYYKGLRLKRSEDSLLMKDMKDRKRVRYVDLLPNDIVLHTGRTVVKHTVSDVSIVNVPSPKTSGEVIQAQKATLNPAEVVPPLPAKSGHDLFKPHSGILINKDPDFVPDVVAIPGSSREVRRKRPKKWKQCNKGGICRNPKCPQKKCRKASRLRMKRQKLRRTLSDSTYAMGVTDGKPRANSSRFPATDEDDPCGLDEIPQPEHVRIPSHLKRGTLATHSLTVLPCTKERKPQVHYGILTGSFNMYDSKFSARSRGRQALTMSVMAYCLAFHYHPKQWTMKLLDNLLDAGDQWYIQCADKVHDHSAVQGICEVLPFGKKQILNFNGKKMQVLLGEPDIVGYTMSLDPTVYNLCRGLRAFFEDNRSGILLTRVMKLVIWKDRVCYYVFDPAGRDARGFSNFATGAAALINVKNLDSVAEVLLARTLVDDQKFVLAPLKVLKMIDEKEDDDLESDPELTQAEKAMMGFRILDESCAIVNANMHLGDRCFEEAKYRQALPIAVIAMTYCKISPPNTWYSKTLDKILRLGNKLYVDCIHPKVMIDITIDNIPNEIMIGPYACEIIIYRERVKGQLFTTKECLYNIRTGLEEFFSHEYSSGILEFNNYSLGIWRQREMFYLFDPYPRTNDGLRTAGAGRACVLMLLNPQAVAAAFTRNWDYLPPTNQFYIHAFKVLKLKKKELKSSLMCALSDEQLSPVPRGGARRVLAAARGRGEPERSREEPSDDDKSFKEFRTSNRQLDEEQMGDITSLVDSVQEDYLPRIPLRYKNLPPEPEEPKIVNLDSPTVSVTQVVPPWPKPRDKTNDPPEPDPEPEPTPPPTPPELPAPEGGEEEEEEEEDEDAQERKKAEEERKRIEEEARRKAEEIPPPLPPPPPSPQPEPELAEAPPQIVEEEVEILEPVQVERQLLLTEDARRRYKLRQLRKEMTQPLSEDQDEITPEEELEKPSNFKTLPDGTEIIKGTNAIHEDNEAPDILPFAAIMAIVTSYKYMINTWTSGIVSFVVDTALKLHANKFERFQLAPVHIIPKIAIGRQAYKANIVVANEGVTWQLEDVLANKFFLRHDRGMITTADYSAAIFKRNGLYYLFDASSCNPMGLRQIGNPKSVGKACFMRFNTLHDMVNRILYNKDGKSDDQQFILSRISVRPLLQEPRLRLPEDYDYSTRRPRDARSRTTLADDKNKSKTRIDLPDVKSKTHIGYQLIEGLYRIEGTVALTENYTPKKESLAEHQEKETQRRHSSDPQRGVGVIGPCHFVSLIAMLLATMHPLRTWDQVMVDTCLEKGLEIYDKATNRSVCEKRAIKNLILNGKVINITIKKILVVNENPVKKIEQVMYAVMRKLRYVIVKLPKASMVVCKSDGYYHLFDPYPPPPPAPAQDGAKAAPVASWTLYANLDELITRLRTHYVKDDYEPDFYTFELASMKNATRSAAFSYRLSHSYRACPDNPNLRFMQQRKIRPLVDEKLYWLNIDYVPWGRMNATNDLGFERKTPKTMWNDWDIEFPGDLYSLWGSLHPLDRQFPAEHRGKQYLAVSVVALALAGGVALRGWGPRLLDGAVRAGDLYHQRCLDKIGNKRNVELTLEDLDNKFDDMYPYSFTVQFDKVIFGFLYNIYPDRFNLRKALSYFFETHTTGLLISPRKNLAFGKAGSSYFMFDCQSYGAPIFSPGQGAAYMLKCESLNRLIYCMTITLNIRRHGQQFHLYSATINLSEKNELKRKSK